MMRTSCLFLLVSSLVSTLISNSVLALLGRHTLRPADQPVLWIGLVAHDQSLLGHPATQRHLNPDDMLDIPEGQAHGFPGRLHSLDNRIRLAVHLPQRLAPGRWPVHDIHPHEGALMLRLLRLLGLIIRPLGLL